MNVIEWLQAWAKQWAWLLATTSLLADSIEKFISDEKKKRLVSAQYLQSIKTFLTVELSQYHKSGSTLKPHFPQVSL